MKHYLIGRLFLTVLFTLFTACGLWAGEIEAGKVYQIVNDNYKLAMTINGPTGNVTCVKPDDKNFDQLWEAERVGSERANKWALRNITTGKYLVSSGRQSGPWTLSEEILDLSTMSISAVGETGSVTIRPSSQANWGMGFAHCDAGKTVVCWDASAPTSQWLLNEVAVNETDKANAAQRLEKVNHIISEAETYKEILGRVFADKACTKLAAGYSDADVKALPDVLQQMVAKVKANDWSETNYNNESIKWDDAHARRFRARDYNVFSRGWEITGLTGVQPHTNMNNPTGIMANAYDVLFIMVDQAPKEDASLYFRAFAHNTMENGWDGDIELHEGLNVVPVWGDGNMGWIYYTCKTWENGGDRLSKPAHKLSEFPPIKIHIEGGLINSYWDNSLDTEDDWFYYRERAQHPMYDILTKYNHIRFFLDKKGWSVTDEPVHNGLKQVLAPGSDRSILTMAKTWDDVYLGENFAIGTMSDEDIATLGRGYYEPAAGDKIAPRINMRDYYNNRHMGIEAQDVKNPNGSSWRTCYPAGNPRGYTDVLNDDVWCVHHEYGHMLQGPMNLVGQTETSNNGLANIATIWGSNRTTRANFIELTADNFSKGNLYCENELWNCVRMFYQLWLYYHGAGYNKKFFPRFYELLRRDPLVHHPTWDAVPTSQLEDGLHLAKLACIAAEEDLTEFFEAWGFLQPCDKFLVGDYTSHYLSLTRDEADQWRAEIAALGLPKNITPLFIDERPGDTERVSYPEARFAKEKAGDVGGLVHFKAHSKVTKPYSYTLSGNSVSLVDGEGGIGFVVRDSKGRLLGFSNKYNFNVSPTTAAKLLSGEAEIYALGEGRDTKPTLCESTMATASPERRAQLISDLIESASVYVDNIDDDSRIVGRIRPEVAGHLRELRDEARSIIDGAQIDKYEDIFSRLSAEYYAVDGNAHKRLSFIPGSTYHLTLRGNKETFNRALAISRNNVRAVENIDLSDKKQHWTFEPAGGDDTYFIRNVSSGNYIQAITRDEVVVTGKEPVALTLVMKEDGAYGAFYYNTAKQSVNYNTDVKVIGWDADNWNSQWLMTLIDSDPFWANCTQLDEVIEFAQDLLDEGGKVDDTPIPVVAPLDASETFYFSNAKCKDTTYGDQFTSFEVVRDDNPATFFHSDYSGADSDDGLDHYIGIDLACGNDSNGTVLTNFVLCYTTRGDGNKNVVAPTHILIQGSKDGKSWIDLKEISQGLPTAGSTDYVTDDISAPYPVRFIRMMVKDNTSGQSAKGHKYFVVSEFSVARSNFVSTPSDDYPAVTPEMLTEVFLAVKNARAIRATSQNEGVIFHTMDTLRAKANKLAEAMGHTTGIDEIVAGQESTSSSMEGIYDLQGRRLRGVSTPGIYIINGRKTLVR
ncbi:MAG: M60 family metallopeptidase [Pseudoflavonifractor sp.]|nr:M60 family metallopeptidase [Alloprevotella sp.]MCM1115914.1 M60 family metallopeptidase [Pseudoflavonifractor sp.]